MAEPLAAAGSNLVDGHVTARGGGSSGLQLRKRQPILPGERRPRNPQRMVFLT
jgi:hypothetical protein